MATKLKAGQGLLAAAATLASGHAAYADIVHFVNPDPGQPGHYDWHFAFVNGWQSWLDITLPPDQQTNAINGSSVGQIFSSHTPPGGYTVISNSTNNGAAVASQPTSYYSPPITLALQLADAVIGLRFNGFARHLYWIDDPIFTNFPLAVRRYIGVKTSAGNYGWIAVERSGYNLTAFAWAYETVPGAPILAGQVPAPGTLALLAFGAMVRPSRKRKP